MEDVKHYYMNLNYEDELYNYETKTSVLRTLESLDFIFFLLNEEDCCFVTKQQFSKEYLNGLKKLGFHITPIKNNYVDALPWWGNFSSLNLKKRFNSKIWFVQVLKELEIETTQNVVQKKSAELTILLSKRNSDVLLKSPYGMSGKRTYLLEKDNELNYSHLSENEIVSVSYTHLTLPTIYSV